MNRSCTSVKSSDRSRICCEYRFRHLSSSRYRFLGMRDRHFEKNSASGDRLAGARGSSARPLPPSIRTLAPPGLFLAQKRSSSSSAPAGRGRNFPPGRWGTGFTPPRASGPIALPFGAFGTPSCIPPVPPGASGLPSGRNWENSASRSV